MAKGKYSKKLEYLYAILIIIASGLVAILDSVGMAFVVMCMMFIMFVMVNKYDQQGREEESDAG